MNRTKIEWADRTWNPVTGCLHGCPYCFAERMTKRFCGIVVNNVWRAKARGIYSAVEAGDGRTLHVLEEPLRDMKGRLLAFPFGFEPTFHKYRLGEQAKVKKAQNVFVVDMGDLFGEWVPDEWIREVFAACEKAPWHQYIYLTKNPGWFMGDSGKVERCIKDARKYWFGFSVTNQKDLNRVAMEARWLPRNFFISIEPMHDLVDLTRVHPVDVDATLDFLTGGQYWFMGGDMEGRKLKWVIVGAETGPGSDARQPKREWVETVVRQCRAAGVPVFLKNNLREVMGGEELPQEWPPTLIPSPSPGVAGEGRKFEK